MASALAWGLIALLAFANGSNDVSKSVATLVGSRVTDCRRALRWGAAWTVVGALLGALVAGSLAERFARSLGVSASHNQAIPVAVVLGSLAWIGFASRTGLPVSTTHAITGAVLGVGWGADGLSPLVRTDVLRGFLLPLLASPFMALALSFLLAPLVARFSYWLDARCVCVVPSIGTVQLAGENIAVASALPELVVDRVPACEGRSGWKWNFSTDHAHWISSALVSLSRGMNDAPKIWGVALPLVFLAGPDSHLQVSTAIVLVTVSMGLGSWRAGQRVTEVLAMRLTRMDQHEGFAANLSTAIVVLGASRLGLPVSTTHVSSGAIVGAGLSQGRRGIDWRVFGEIAVAWLLTVPASCLIAAFYCWALR